MQDFVFGFPKIGTTSIPSENFGFQIIGKHDFFILPCPDNPADFFFPAVAGGKQKEDKGEIQSFHKIGLFWVLIAVRRLGEPAPFQ